MRKRGNMKRNQISLAPVRLHAQIYRFHDPHPSPPSACSFCLPQSSFLSSPSPALPPKFNLVFACDGEEPGGFMSDTVEYIKLQEKINKWSNLSVLVSLHWMSMIWLWMLFYLLFFPKNAIRCSVRFVAEYWYWLSVGCADGDGWKREGSPYC